MKLNENGMDEDEDVFINQIESESGLEEDGGDHFPESLALEGSEVDSQDLPTALIITNVDVNVFNFQADKDEFEKLFTAFEQHVTFQYFKSFRRARANFCTSAAAAMARIKLHQYEFGNSIINCYFAQPTAPKEEMNETFLQPPAPVKQFLISPPASPPVGWEPVDETEPVINYDLLAAIANLTPGEVHELHPPSDHQPGIVVHVCEEMKDTGGRTISNSKPKMVPTACPQKRGT